MPQLRYIYAPHPGMRPQMLRTMHEQAKSIGFDGYVWPNDATKPRWGPKHRPTLKMGEWETPQRLSQFMKRITT